MHDTRHEADLLQYGDSSLLAKRNGFSPSILSSRIFFELDAIC